MKHLKGSGTRTDLAPVAWAHFLSNKKMIKQNCLFKPGDNKHVGGRSPTRIQASNRVQSSHIRFQLHSLAEVL